MSCLTLNSPYPGIWYEEDDDEYSGRILTKEQFLNKLRIRPDIFAVEKNIVLRKIEIYCLITAIFVGIWLNTTKLEIIRPDMFSYLPVIETDYTNVSILTDAIDLRKERVQKYVSRKKVIAPNNIKEDSKSWTSGKSINGGGDYKSRVTMKNFLTLVSGLITGAGDIDGDPLTKGGYEKRIDVILAGSGTLKKGNTGDIGRKSAAGIGFGIGNISGFGEGSGSIGDELDRLMHSDAHATLSIKKHAKLYLPSPAINRKGIVIGGRSKNSIMRVVKQYINGLRYAYNRRLREKPGLKGTIHIKFAIDEFGKVIFCEIIKSSMNDEAIEKTVVSKISRWVFDKIDKPGDVTEVIYPFVFSV